MGQWLVVADYRLRRVVYLIVFGFYFLVFGFHRLSAQPVSFSLSRTIEMATDSSLQAFRAKNQYMAGYWAYRTFQAGRLPSLTLRTTPIQYNRVFASRYDSEANIDVYRSQQSLYSNGNLSLSQNFDLTGGTFFIDSELNYMYNPSNKINPSQFSAAPFRIGYSQSLFGFNSFKWEKKIEPLKYEKAKTQFLYSQEEISETAIQYFFSLAIAQLEYDMATDNVASSDTLYRFGQERQKIASISQADLLTLKLDAVNARNSLKNASSSLKRAMFNFVSFLNIDKETAVKLELPDRPVVPEISPELALEYARKNNPDFIANQQELLEAERDVERTKKISRFDASFSASFGFSQAAYHFPDAYRNLDKESIVRVGLTIPLVDWGVRKGQANMAINNLNISRISIQQRVTALEQDVIMTANDFNIQQDLLQSAEEALTLAVMAYQTTKERFIIGKSDLNSLTLSLNRQNSAQRNYLAALKEYWLNYYKLRKLTLFDFEKGEGLGIRNYELRIMNYEL